MLYSVEKESLNKLRRRRRRKYIPLLSL